MTTPNEVAQDILSTRAAIRAWRVPDELIERSTAQNPREHWNRLRRSVVRNCEDGLRLATRALRANNVDEADNIVAAVQRRWTSWLRQVSAATTDPLLSQGSITERASDALERYYDGVTEFAENVANLPANIEEGMQTAAAVAIGAAFLFLAMKR